MRRLSTWLAAGLALAVVVPGALALSTWLVVGARQDRQVDDRAYAAAKVIAKFGPKLQYDTGLPAPLGDALASLHVEAEVEPPKPTGTSPYVLKQAAVSAVPLQTDAITTLLQGDGDGKRRLQQRYATRTFETDTVRGTLFVERPSRATRVAATSAATLVALLLVLTLCLVLLRRHVLQPLRRLAANADRIAGGDLDITPVASRAREVDDVGRALSGMAGELGDAHKERDAAEEQRRFLVTAMAHDLRTPLFTLRGSLEAIEHGIGGDADHLTRAQDKAAVLDRLVGDLFAYSRVGYATPQRESLDAAALAREAAQAVDARIVVKAPAGPTNVEADHAALLRILLNLLDNATRHAHSTVELTVATDHDGVTFTVSDDGDGIAEGDLPHLFEPLFRADRARAAHAGGAGLGLAIVDRLSAAQGATVTAGNGPQGACFTVHVPHVAKVTPAPF